MRDMPFRYVTLMGFGEAGGILGEDVASAGVSVAMYDILHRKQQEQLEWKVNRFSIWHTSGTWNC